MDNVKTKLQTQNTTSTCEKVDNMIKEFEKEKDLSNSKLESKNKGVKPATPFSTIQKSECNTEPTIKYKNILSTMKMIHREDGFFRGFFKGLTPRIISNAPSCAISWGTYEMIKHFLSKKKQY